MKEMEVWAGENISNAIRKALGQAPCFFIFNGCRIDVVESMVGHKGATDHLYSVYHALLSGKTAPTWSVKPAEKPCKTCGKNNFLTDKKCWWCETTNPCQ